MDMDSNRKFYLFRRRAQRDKNISALRDFLKLAEKSTPIEEGSFDGFANDELGKLLTRMVGIYNVFAKQQSSLSQAQHRAIIQTQEQIRNKKQLTQNINHELKTPVSSIKGYLETIINNPKISEKQRNDFLLKCYEQTTRLSDLLQDLSVITRMDEASEMIEKERISLSAIVEESVTENAFAADQKGIVITNTVPEGLEIVGNKALLQSVFTNLFLNAIQYSNGKNIEITLQDTTTRFYVLSFSDDGVGISQEHISRIFERFYRVDKGRSRKLGGTGLGLSIVKNAIAIHGGSISARSKEGGGLEFVFSLAKGL